MQILEASFFGLRAVRLEFRRPGSPTTVTLFPMVHVGDEGFYRAVYDDAFGHDVVLVEGVKSAVVRHLSRAYRWLDLRKLGLIVQPAYPAPGSVAARIANADLTTEEFHRAWRKIGLHMRMFFAILVPLIGLHRRLFASRESLCRKLSLEDLESADEKIAWDPSLEPVRNSLIHARDLRLLECLAAELDIPAEPEKRIAIVFGAGHMPAVINGLARRGFHCAQASWLSVIA